MKAPNLPTFSDRRPSSQEGQARGSLPSPLSGKMCGPSRSFSASSTSVTRRSLMSSIESREIAPEIAQNFLPVDFRIRHEVELFFEARREIIFDVAREETFEEGDDEPAFVLRHEPLLVDLHIVAVAQHGERRGIGGGTADAEFFHALDERRFREARRRLGEMLRRLDLVARSGLVVATWRAGGSQSSSASSSRPS